MIQNGTEDVVGGEFLYTKTGIKKELRIRRKVLKSVGFDVSRHLLVRYIFPKKDVPSIFARVSSVKDLIDNLNHIEKKASIEKVYEVEVFFWVPSWISTCPRLVFWRTTDKIIKALHDLDQL